MSLKRFHIFFIVISTLLCVGMILWGVYYFKTSGQWTGFLFSGIGLVGAILLYRYLKWFLQKYSKILSVALGTILVGVSTLQTSSLWACGTCYQDPDSLLTQGTISGVWFLVGVIVSVLITIAWIGYSWQKRARRLQIEL